MRLTVQLWVLIHVFFSYNTPPSNCGFRIAICRINNIYPVISLSCSRSLFHVISSSCYFHFRVSPLTSSHSTDLRVLLQLKVWGSCWCCHIYRNTVQMTHHADNLKTPFFAIGYSFLTWDLHSLLLSPFPKVKVSGCACLWFRACDCGCQKLSHAQTVLAEIAGFYFEVSRINTFPLIPAKKETFHVSIIHQVNDFTQVKWWAWILLPQWLL